MKPATAEQDVISTRGGTTSEVHWSSMPSPLGLLYAGVNDAGLCAIKFGRERDDMLSPGNDKIPTTKQALLDDIFKQLNEYFDKQRTHFTLKTDVSALTDFQQLVLQTLSRIDKGEVWTYRHVAEAIGKPKASRAVGQALGRNPIPIVIPCHRVVASGGGLGGYSGGSGVTAKLWLLRHEGVFL